MHILRGWIHSGVPVKWSQWSPSSFSALVGSQPHTPQSLWKSLLSGCALISPSSFAPWVYPHYCSHGTFAVTEITKTGFLCIILFCLASWWWCNVKLFLSIHKHWKKVHHKSLQPRQGSSVNMYHLYTARRRDVPGCTSLNVDSVKIVCFLFFNVTTFPSHSIVTCQL